MKKEALLLIDIQNIYFTPGQLLLHKPKEAANNASRVLEKFRMEKKTVRVTVVTARPPWQRACFT